MGSQSDWVFSADVSEWEDFADIVEDFQTALPNQMTRFLLALGRSFKDTLQIEIGPHRWTGTYSESITASLTEEDNPRLTVGLIPKGPESEKLDIYWRVLEEGGEPNPSVPKVRLIQWAKSRFGNSNIGLIAHKAIMARGIKPHPILQSLFLLDDSLSAVGLTSVARAIVEKEIENLSGFITEHIRRGRRTQVRRHPAGSPEGGRFM